MTTRYVILYRVSTARQGRSGLGLEAQEQAVKEFLTGKDARVIGTFTEVESGKAKNRPQLRAAMEMARAYGGVLLVAKVCRLARDAAFLLSLKDAGIEFAAADLPEANRLTVGILALVAEQEHASISTRTKAALEARRARGLPLGNPASLRPGTPAVAAVASRAASRVAAEHAARVRPIIDRFRGEGLSLNAIARQLNADAVPTARGGAWTATSVRNLLNRS